MSSPLSNELFFEAHRGLWEEPKDLNKKNLGSHWSANYNVSSKFARSLDEIEDKKGIILHGNIPMSSVETDPVTLQVKDVFTHRNSMEHEVPVKTGASVFLTGKTHLRLNPKFDPERADVTGHKIKKRKINYNPPREMKA